MIEHAHHFKTSVVLSALLLIASATTSAQQVYSSAGSEFQNGSTRIAFTIGEPVIETHSAPGFTLTQGFHQPPADFSTEVIAIADPVVVITAFPNPAREQVTVVAEGINDGLELRLLDAAGRLIATHASVPSRHTFDVSALSSGCYTILALSADQRIATIKLTIAR